MSHDLNIVNGQASMVYHDEVPWHKLGKRFDRRLTVTEALDESNANYKVAKWPMDYYNPAKPDEIYNAEEIFATVRLDTMDSLGYVGPDYTILQNDVAFNFLSPIIDSGEGIIETMGVLGKGERAWALIKLPDNIIVSKKDEVGKYVLVYNAFNGKQKLRAKYTPTRVVCWNTLQMALSGIDTEVAIRHTTNAEAMLKEAHKVMGMAVNVSKTLELVYQAMAKKKITDKQMVDYVKTLIPIAEDAKRTTRTENIHLAIMNLYETGAGAEFSRGSLWGAYNAITEYVDHMFSGGKDANERLNTIWFGAGEDLKLRAFSEAVAVLKG